MSTAAAPTIASAYDPASDELVRDARERERLPRLERLRRRLYAAVTLVVAAGAFAALAFVHGGPSLAPAAAIVLVAAFAALSRVRFETGLVFAVPTQLALVPMLLLLPLRIVPVCVVAAFMLGRSRLAIQLRDPSRLLAQFTNAAHALGPVLVLSLAGTTGPRWSAWPIYLAALAAQFAVDLAVSIVCEYGNGVGPVAVARYSVLAWTVDACLAPIGLFAAFATKPHPVLVVLLLPLALLLRQFSHERKHRIDNALELSDAYRGTAFLLGDVVEADDAYTGDHSRHVLDLVLSVADELKLDAADRRVAEFVALLHDVGKIKIPGEIISKPGPLTAEERAIIETHTVEGERLLEQVGGLLGHVGRVVRSCHEHWDGRGYPDGLRGEEIPLVARIVCACDAFSAMTTDRPYRAARSTEEALAEMRRCAGTQFDPQVVDALCRAAG